MADANHAYDVNEALVIGRVLEDCEYAWFEEPVSPQPYLYVIAREFKCPHPSSSGR